MSDTACNCGLDWINAAKDRGEPFDFPHKPGCPFGAYEQQNRQPVSITVDTFADRIHGVSHKGERHLSIHSCSCTQIARYYLLGDKPNLFWPKEDGSNAWPEWPDWPDDG